MSLISLPFVSPAVVCLCSLALGWDHCLAGVNRDANILCDGALRLLCLECGLHPRPLHCPFFTDRCCYDRCFCSPCFHPQSTRKMVLWGIQQIPQANHPRHCPDSESREPPLNIHTTTPHHLAYAAPLSDLLPRPGIEPESTALQDLALHKCTTSAVLGQSLPT